MSQHLLKQPLGHASELCQSLPSCHLWTRLSWVSVLLKSQNQSWFLPVRWLAEVECIWGCPWVSPTLGAGVTLFSPAVPCPPLPRSPQACSHSTSVGLSAPGP